MIIPYDFRDVKARSKAAVHEHRESRRSINHIASHSHSSQSALLAHNTIKAPHSHHGKHISLLALFTVLTVLLLLLLFVK